MHECGLRYFNDQKLLVHNMCNVIIIPMYIIDHKTSRYQNDKSYYLFSNHICVWNIAYTAVCSSGQFATGDFLGSLKSKNE